VQMVFGREQEAAQFDSERLLFCLHPLVLEEA